MHFIVYSQFQSMLRNILWIYKKHQNDFNRQKLFLEYNHFSIVFLPHEFIFSHWIKIAEVISKTNGVIQAHNFHRSLLICLLIVFFHWRHPKKEWSTPTKKSLFPEALTFGGHKWLSWFIRQADELYICTGRHIVSKIDDLLQFHVKSCLSDILSLIGGKSTK